MNLIKPTRLILILLIQSIASGVEKSIPSDLQRIIDIRQREIIEINKKYMSSLEAKKKRYIARHKVRENWEKSGIKTAGFWSKHLLWSEPTLTGSIKKIENKFNVNIID